MVRYIQRGTGITASERISVIAGDFIQNLRIALDYLVWQLVHRESEKPDGRHFFPIHEDPRQFNGEVKFRKREPEKSPLFGIPIDGDAWTIIEKAQPFNCVPAGPPGDPLATPYGSPVAVLKRLSNADKHQSLLYQEPIPERSTLLRAIGWSDEVRLVEYRVTGLPLSLERPTEIIRLRFAPSNRDAGMYVKGNITLNPTFGEIGTKAKDDGFIYGTQVTVGTGTDDLVKTVRGILEKIARLPRVIGWEPGHDASPSAGPSA